MLEAFRAFVLEERLLPQEGPTLLAVSGGVDSIVMSNLFHLAKLHFAVAHCNFGLRGAASDQDEAWVRTLAQQYKVAFYRHAFDTAAHAREQGISIQMAARTLRHAWFQQLCTRYGFEKVSTAHHSSDNVETILINIARGTGISGLRGMTPTQGNYIKPLLFTDKASILNYAQEEGLFWREDHSNHRDAYARNTIRHRVIPWLKKLNPSLEATSRRTSTRLKQVEDLFKERVDIIKRKLCRRQGQDYHIAIDTIRNKPWAPVVAWELLKSLGFSFTQVNTLLAKNRPIGTVVETNGHRLYVDRRHWIVTPYNTPTTRSYQIDATMKHLAISPCTTLHCTHSPRKQYSITAHRQVAALDCAQLHFPLIVRRWQPGDIFYPLGMQQRKKLSDFFIDCKIPRPTKARVWVVTSEGEIVWVVGYRIDNRFKVTDSTRRVYEIRCKTLLEETAQ